MADEDNDNGKKKPKKSTRESVEGAWSTARSVIRQCVYELAFSYVVQLAFILPLALGSSFLGLLASGFVFLTAGSVVSLGIGVVGNPLLILNIAVIHLIDDDLGPNQSRGWFFGKSFLKAILSGVGAFLAGLSGRALFGGLLPVGLLPANVLPGTDFATGITVWFLMLGYYHVMTYLAIHTDDGFGMITSLGLAQFVFGFLTFSIWQVVPNLNYLFSIATAVAAWPTFAWWDLAIEFGAVLLVLGLYYLFFRDVFSTRSRRAAQSNGLADDVALLLDTQEDGEKNAGTGQVGSAARKW